jgi:hypothetical protein
VFSLEGAKKIVLAQDDDVNSSIVKKKALPMGAGVMGGDGLRCASNAIEPPYHVGWFLRAPWRI